MSIRDFYRSLIPVFGMILCVCLAAHEVAAQKKGKSNPSKKGTPTQAKPEKSTRPEPDWELYTLEGLVAQCRFPTTPSKPSETAFRSDFNEHRLLVTGTFSHHFGSFFSQQDIQSVLNHLQDDGSRLETWKLAEKNILFANLIKKLPDGSSERKHMFIFVRPGLAYFVGVIADSNKFNPDLAIRFAKGFKMIL